MKNLSSKNTINWASSGLGLQTKILAILLIVSLVPVIAVALISVNQTRNALTNAAEFSLSAGAAQVATTLDSTIKSKLDSIRAEAQQSNFVTYMGLSPTEQMTSELRNTVRSDLITLSLKEPAYILSYALVNLNGKVLVDTVDANVGTSEKSSDYFIKVLSTEIQYATSTIYDKENRLIMHFASPVRDSSGKIIGVLRVAYRAELLQEILTKNTQEAGQNVNITLFDEHNIRMADSGHPELIQKSLVPLGADALKQAVQAGRLLPDTPETQSTNDTEYNKVLNNSKETPFFVVKASSATEGANAVAVAQLRAKPWKVAYSQPEALFLQGVQRQTYTNIFLVIGVAILVAVIAFVSSRQLTTPIKELTNVASELSAGNMKARSSITSKDEIGVLASTLNNMAVDLQESRDILEQRVADRTKALSSVAEVSNAVSTILETDKLLQQVVDLAKERFNLYHTHIYLLNEAGDALVLSSGAGEVGRQMVAEGRSIPLDREQSLVARAAREKKGVTVNDVTTAPDFLPNPLLPDTHSEMAVPMMVGEQVIGVFDVQSDVVGRFTDADIAVQTTLASQVASAVQNARSYTKVKEAEQLTRTIIDATTDIIFMKDRQHRYLLVNEGYANPLNMHANDLIGKDDLELGFPEELVLGNPEKGIRGFWTDDDLVFETGKTQHYPNDPIIIDGVAHILDTLKIPLRNVDGDIWAVLGFSRDVTEREHLHELTVQRARQQETINTITQKIQSTVTVEEAMQVAARELGHALGRKQTVVSLDLNNTILNDHN